ncbi:MAG: hypothetical protein WEC75_05350 [Dehalococcoidia bacterium]
MIRKSIGAVGAVAAAVLLLAACGGDGNDVTTRTVAPGSPGPRPNVGYTNVPQVDQVLNTALSRDSIELARITGYQRVGCANEPQAFADGPICRSPDEPDGQEVEVFPHSGCQDDWIRPEQIPDIYRAQFDRDGVQVYAVYTPAGDAVRYGAEYVAVVTAGDEAAALYIHDGRLVSLEVGCVDVGGLLDDARVDNFLFQP